MIDLCALAQGYCTRESVLQFQFRTIWCKETDRSIRSTHRELQNSRNRCSVKFPLDLCKESFCHMTVHRWICQCILAHRVLEEGCRIFLIFADGTFTIQSTHLKNQELEA